MSETTYPPESQPWFFSTAWFITAEASNSLVWISSITDDNKFELVGILPLFNESGEFSVENIGNIILTYLFYQKGAIRGGTYSHFNDILSIFEPNSLAYLTDENGYLIAANENVDSIFIPAVQSASMVGTVATCIKNQKNPQQSLQCKVDGTNYFVSILQFNVFSLSWTVVLAEPQNLYLNSFNQSNMLAIVVSVIVVFLCSFIGVLATLLIIRPIENLARVMEGLTSTTDVSVAIDKLRQNPGQFSPLQEVKHIQQAFFYLISKLSEFVADLNRLKQTAEKSNEAKTMFLSKMSHELR